ncbi:hypothetical protein BMAA0775 [Burkholderia mallei ATCC 23344]|uniref:Uncharacterized protein n=4 Tax=pseudomallei group TaxID=111527 RepID=A0A0H2WD60_BURMA|nr:hypothetical protein BMAA0775 [Burkholderia mallei ATCC 23344]KOT22157.1 hypothetical protein DM47_3733 [Burkholderia mallei]
MVAIATIGAMEATQPVTQPAAADATVRTAVAPRSPPGGRRVRRMQRMQRVRRGRWARWLHRAIATAPMRSPPMRRRPSGAPDPIETSAVWASTAEHGRRAWRIRPRASRTDERAASAAPPAPAPCTIRGAPASIRADAASSQARQPIR